jgi:hypothetical protein
MFSDWYRQGNYYKNCYPFSDIVEHRVTFKNAAFSVTILEIEIVFYHTKELKIWIKASKLHWHELNDLVKKHFGPFVDINNSNLGIFEGVSIVFLRPTDDLKVQFFYFVKLFDYLNKKYERTEFTDTLLKELSNILTWTSASRLGNNTIQTHILEEYINPISVFHPYHIRKSTAVLDLFENKSSKYIQNNILIIRKKLRYLITYGEDPNQISEDGYSVLKYVILYFPVEDLAFLLWHKADPRYRPKGILNYPSENAIEIALYFNKPDHFKMIAYAFPKRSVSAPIPRLQVKSCQVTEQGDQIHSDIVFTNNRSVKTRLMTTTEFQTQEPESVRTAVFKLFTTYFADPTGDKLKTKQNFDKEFSAEKNKNIDIVFDREEKLIVGFVLVRAVEDKGTIAVRFEYMTVTADSFLRSCGGVGIFGIRWACVKKNLYRQHMVRTHHLASDYNSYAPMQDELITPKYLSKSMLEFNQRMLDLEFGRRVQIYYGRFIALKELLKVTDKKNPHRKISFDEFCYNQFVLLYDNPEDKKKLAQEVGVEPVQAAVVSSVVGAGFLKRRTQIFKTFLNFDLCEHVSELTPIMKRKANVFMPGFAHYKQSTVSPLLKFEDFGDERLEFWLGVQTMSRF